jgi:hypothetical protein
MPPLSLEQRLDRLLEIWGTIYAALADEFTDLHFKIPERVAVHTAAALKPYEDALDAIISAWVGACFLQGVAQAYGDQNAAIWVPTARLTDHAKHCGND